VRGIAASLEHAGLVLEHEVQELAVAELRSLGALDELVGGLAEQ
jgi:hypothetical protein